MNNDTIGVTADIGYAVETGEKPVNETFEAGQIIRRRSGATEQRSMHIHDGRLQHCDDGHWRNRDQQH